MCYFNKLIDIKTFDDALPSIYGSKMSYKLSGLANYNFKEPYNQIVYNLILLSEMSKLNESHLLPFKKKLKN